MLVFSLSAAALLLQTVSSHALPHLSQRTGAASNLQVDVGYAIYQGFIDYETGLNAWEGIRYAAAPLGDLRWRRPRAPATDRSAVIDANVAPPYCPQTPASPTPAGFAYQGDEDCLFLNVYAPPNAQNLPVFFYIHGGGYGGGSGSTNVSQISEVSKLGFVSVVIQYRLGAFGFLASTDVHNNGTANAGLHDQHFALIWAQEHVAKFGGDPRRVTIAGESAGGGSVELQAMAYGGSEGTKNFEQGIASSPYTPVTYRYSDPVPETFYQRFAQQAGCLAASQKTAPGIMDCLRSADTNTLQLASFDVSTSTNFGSWAFVPVVDGNFVQERASQQLASGKVNGARMLTGNNGDEGAAFTSPNITTAAEFNDWLLTEYPLLTSKQINQINTIYYPFRPKYTTPFATCGNCGGPNAVNVGSFAVGHQQRAINFYSEATFVCPSYWLASAYTRTGKEGYKYQFSIPAAEHALDIAAEGIGGYTSATSPNISPDFFLALTSVWGNFIETGNPSISNLLANGNSTGNTKANPASQFPMFTTTGSKKYQMLNFNETGGVPYSSTVVAGLPPVVQYTEPGLTNAISLVNADTWEGGRGARCDFLKSIGANIAT